MIIYFTDRNLNILAHASTELRQGYLIIDDLTTESIESGVSIFEATIYANKQDELVLQDLLETGCYILKNKDVSTTSGVTVYDSLYQVISTEYDILEKKLKIYCEDAGLDLINTVVQAYNMDSAKTITQAASIFMPQDWTAINDDLGDTTKTLSWDGENTLTNRLLSIANSFNAELYYTFTVDRLTITEKAVHFCQRRGSTEPIAQLRMNYDINNITILRNMENLATALSVTGGTDEISSTPIDLKGYTYEYIDDKGDKYAVDTTTGQMRNLTQMNRWAGALDEDGLIVKSFSYETTNKSTLAGAARAALQKICYPEVNYEVDIIHLPDDVKIGDKVNILADRNHLYLEARILELQTSVVQGTVTATLGDYLLKNSGISKYLEELAAKFSQDVKNGIILPVNVYIDSSAGELFTNGTVQTTMTATVQVGNTICTNYTELRAALPGHSSYALDWYVDGTYASSGFSYTLNKTATTKIYAKLDLDFS